VNAARQKRLSGLTPTGETTGLRVGASGIEESQRNAGNKELNTEQEQPGGSASPAVSLDEAGHACRLLIESINEGALIISSAKTILYANRCFARMVKRPFEAVTGESFLRFLSPADATALRTHMKSATGSGTRIQATLRASDGSRLPVQISACEIADNGSGDAISGLMVTDITAARRTEEVLRALTNRMVQLQEAERGRVALDLHDNITQLLCAVLFRSQALAEKLSEGGGAPENDANRIRDMLGQTAREVERISHNLRSSVLDQLGLVPVLRDASLEFATRTGVAVNLDLDQFAARLDADTELALYRILQQTLANVEAHAQAQHVDVVLTRQGSFVRLKIKDDGRGFNPEQHEAGEKNPTGLGLLGMSERAAFVGGTFAVKSARNGGTVVDVKVPLVAPN
jgi:PAS domain S-box-containing protein